MKKIGAFFEKKKTDMKFKQAGHGVKLNDSTPQPRYVDLFNNLY